MFAHEKAFEIIKCFFVRDEFVFWEAPVVCLSNGKVLFRDSQEVN